MNRKLKNISRREFIKSSSLGVLSTAFSFGAFSCGQRKKEKPNFVFLLADDQRWDGMSCVADNILKTPHMDRIAQEGIRFENMFVTTSLCGPSRASLLTGKYAHNMDFSSGNTTFLISDSCTKSRFVFLYLSSIRR